jgi:hypothetical protein
MLTIIFPCQYDDLTAVDFVWADEYTAAQAIPGLSVARFSHMLWAENGEIRIEPMPAPGPVLMRGYMQSPEQYTEFYTRLQALGLILVTNPAQYTLFHLFPNIYPEFKSHTPKTLFFLDGTPIDYALINSTFKSFLIKDYVKSVKEQKFPKKFTTPVDEATLSPFLQKFRDFRGPLFTRGFVFKEFVNFKTYKVLKYETNEYRAFYLKGKPLLVHPNSNQPQGTPVVPNELVAFCSDKGSDFYTVDFAELEDGSWIIVEAGDGGFSGTPAGLDLAAFFSGIAATFGVPDK